MIIKPYINCAIKWFRKILILILIFKWTSSVSQTAGINYQALILNADNAQIPGTNDSQNKTPLVLETVTFRFSITDDSDIDLYIEEQDTMTDDNGLISLVIGEGIPFLSSFDAIIWDGTTKYLKVEIDIITNGNGFVALDLQKILYLPQAGGISTMTVANGLSKNENTLSLGGALTKPTDISTTAINTLSITGLETGNLSDDELVVIDKTTGVLKKIMAPSLVQEKQKLIIANDGQTQFTSPLSIDNPEKLNVYRNGIKIDFTILDTSTIKLETGVVCYQDDEIRIVQFY